MSRIWLPSISVWVLLLGSLFIAPRVLKLPGSLSRSATVVELRGKELRGENTLPYGVHFTLDQSKARIGILTAALILNQGSTKIPSVNLQTAGMLVVILSAVLVALLIVHVRTYRRDRREIRRRKEFEVILSDITARLADSQYKRTGDEIRHALDRVRQYLNVERVSVFTRPVDGEEFRLLSSSFEEQIGPPPPALAKRSFPWAMEQLLQGQALIVAKTDRLSEQALAERDFFRSLTIKSVLVVPIETNRTVVALFTLTELKRHRGWPKELVRQVQILGNVLYQAHARHLVESNAYDLEQRFSLAVDNAPVMIWMSDTSKGCTYFNHGWLAFTGRPLNEELGDGWVGGVHPADAERCVADYSAAFVAREKFQLEYRLRRFDGDYRWILDYGVPRYGPDGTFRGYIGSCIDVTDARRTEQELKELSSRLIDAQESERQRIARELHDDFSQQLTLLALELAKLNTHAGRDPKVEALVLTLEARIRRLAMALNSRAHQLHSSHLDTLGLPSAIQGFCRDFSEQYEIAVDFRQKSIPSPLPSNISLCLFRIVQEGLQNIAKHSRTRNCWIDLAGEGGEILLRIADSGVGFDPASPPGRTGIGMISMRERLRLVNGNIRVLSSPAKGTRLEVRVPIGRVSASA